jgi:Domain of unknown function (DUF4332)
MPNDKLRQQVAELEEENQRLKSRTEHSTADDIAHSAADGTGSALVCSARDGAAPLSPQEDFASAVSSAIDSLQTQMSQMSNRVSDFAVREASLQVKVSLEVTPLGTLNYRLVRPEDPIDPQKISTLSLTVVPVPKPEGHCALKPAQVNTEVGVAEVAGIGDALSARLHRNNIYTVGEFLQAGTRARSAVQLAALLEVDRRCLSELMAQAQLLMLNGIDGPTAEVLHSAGIRGFNDLAALTSEEVVSRYERRAAALGQKRPARINPAAVKAWIDTARIYLRTGDQPADQKRDV